MKVNNIVINEIRKFNEVVENLNNDSVVLVYGRPDSGKTTLLMKFAVMKGVPACRHLATHNTLNRMAETQGICVLDNAESFFFHNKRRLKRPVVKSKYIISVEKGRDENHLNETLGNIEKWFGVNEVDLIHLSSDWESVGNLLSMFGATMFNYESVILSKQITIPVGRDDGTIIN